MSRTNDSFDCWFDVYFVDLIAVALTPNCPDVLDSNLYTIPSLNHWKCVAEDNPHFLFRASSAWTIGSLDVLIKRRCLK